MMSKSQALKILRTNAPASELSRTNQSLVRSLSKLSQLTDSGRAFDTAAGRKLASRLPERFKKGNHSVCVLKTGKSYSITGNGKLSRDKHYKWLNSGMMINGVVLTVKVSESPKVAHECILSDILQKHVPKRYFVSKQVLSRILKQ